MDDNVTGLFLLWLFSIALLIGIPVAGVVLFFVGMVYGWIPGTVIGSVVLVSYVFWRLGE